MIIDDPAEATPAWLSEVLHRAGVDADVATVDAAPVGTGLMASCYRLAVTYARGEGPSSFVVKLASTNAESRTGGSISYRAEVRFYRDLAPTLPVEVPRCYLAEITDEMTTFTLVLEDLTPAQQGDQLAGCTPDQARAAASNIAGLHATTWCDPGLAGLDWIIPSGPEVAEGTAPFVQQATDAFLDKRPDFAPELAEVMRAFAGSYVAWARARTERFSLIHSDYRLDNLLFGAGRVVAVDWQTPMIGHPVRDVAYLLGTGLAPDDRRDNERSIVDDYRAALGALGVEGYDAGTCWDDYRHGLFQGPLITTLGEFVAKTTERSHGMFTVMAERSVTAIRDLDAFAALDR